MKTINYQITVLFVALLSIFCVGILSSCNKSEEPLLMEQLDNAQVSHPKERFLSNELRSLGDIVNPSWTPGSFDNIAALKYEVQDPYQLSGNRYRFVVRSNTWEHNDLYIKYYSPQGNIVYEKMIPNRDYSSFEVERTFQQNCTYHIRFYVSSSIGRNYPSIHRDSYRIEVELPVNIPEEGDDYKQNVKITNYSSGASDQWDFGPYQCTSWVALKINQMWGTKTRFKNKMYGTSSYDKLGDAYHWKDVLERNGYKVEFYPKPGCIIWFPPNQKAWDPIEKRMVTYSTNLGYVGFVHKVTSNSVIWTEYHGGREASYTKQDRTLDALPPSTRFIHVQKRIY